MARTNRPSRNAHDRRLESPTRIALQRRAEGPRVTERRRAIAESLAD